MNNDFDKSFLQQNKGLVSRNKEINDLNKLIEKRYSNLKILIIGSTGFVGKWLIEMLQFLNYNSKINLHVASSKVRKSHTSKFRNLEIKFIPYLWEQPNYEFYDEYDVIFHFGNYQNTNLNLYNKNQILYAEESSKHIIHLVRKSKQPPKVIFASSGAVYGSNNARQPFSEDTYVSENLSIYGKAKRLVEDLLQAESQGLGFKFIAARLFTFYGPFLPLNSNYFIGQLMRSSCTKMPFLLKSYGNSYRSYMHGEDLALRILQLTCSDFIGAINIGSAEAVSLISVMNIFERLLNVTVHHSDNLDDTFTYYIPNVNRCNYVLGELSPRDFEKEIMNWKMFEEDN